MADRVVSDVVDRIMRQVGIETAPGKMSRVEAAEVYGQLVDEFEVVLEDMHADSDDE